MKYKCIGFCGASGTGKTTLASWIAERTGLPLNPVGSRSVAQELGFESPYDVDKASIDAYRRFGLDPKVRANVAINRFQIGDRNCRSMFQNALLDKKVEWENLHADSGFVTDRTTVDNYVYSTLHAPDEMTVPYMQVASDHLDVYDVIFFTSCTRFHNVSSDPMRSDNTAYHYSFELFANGVLTDWRKSQKIHFIDSSDREARIREVASVLGIEV